MTFFPCLLGESLRFEMQFGHVETRIFVWYISLHFGIILMKLRECTRCYRYCWTIVSREGHAQFFVWVFNACIRLVSRSDDVDLVGSLSFGECNAQGMLLA